MPKYEPLKESKKSDALNTAFRPVDHRADRYHEDFVQIVFLLTVDSEIGDCGQRLLERERFFERLGGMHGKNRRIRETAFGRSLRASEHIL